MSRRGPDQDIADSPTGLDALALISRAGDPSGNPANGIRYESRGVVLVAGPAEPTLPVARSLAATLRVVALVDGPVADDEEPAGVTLVPGRLAAVSGYLGSFRAEAVAGGRTAGLGPLSPNRDGLFDLILDLNATPRLSREVPPLGYFAPGSDADALADTLGRLPGLTGAFTKPKFFDYSPELCAHGRRGLTGCVRCLDACPAGAIETDGDKIRVEPQLCQGCGTCTAVCPTGAIRYAWPSADTITKRFERDLTAARPRRLLIFEDGSRGGKSRRASPTVPAGVLTFGVPALAAMGMELWFAALAAGVEQVLLCIPQSQRERGSMSSLIGQVECAHAVLIGLGQEPNRLRVIDDAGDQGVSQEHVTGPPLPLEGVAKAVLQAPSLLQGEGGDGGSDGEINDIASFYPHPNPPPARGRGLLRHPPLGEGRGEGINKADQTTVPDSPHPSLLPEGEGTGPLESSATSSPRDEESLPDLPEEKREAIFAALEHLPASAAGTEARVLPPGAPFGQVLVDPESCTLCLSCAMVCPRDALHGDPGQSEGSVPRLSFQESRCIQCGLCQAACPEDAIRLEARFMPDPSTRDTPRVVAEGKQAQCVGCGAPIGSEQMLVRLEGQLKDHPMFSGENLRRLRLCQRCKSVQ